MFHPVFTYLLQSVSEDIDDPSQAVEYGQPDGLSPIQIEINADRRHPRNLHPITHTEVNPLGSHGPL